MPRDGMIKNYLSGVVAMAFLALAVGCSTDPRIVAIEQTALNSAVQIGNQYANTGQVDKGALVTTGISNGAALLSELIANQATANPEIAASASQTAIVASAPASVAADVKTQLAPSVASAIDSGIKQGLAPGVAVKAAAAGLNKGVKKLKSRSITAAAS